jgi:hypothetical protein
MMEANPRMETRPTMLRQTAVAYGGIFLALVLSVSGSSTWAADTTRNGSFGKGKAHGPLLTRAELRECLKVQERVKSLGEETTSTQAALDKEKAVVAEESKVLAERLAALDRTSSEAVNAYNADAQAHDKRIDAYNAQTPGFNAKVEALQGARAQFAKSCENRDFDEKDELAIRKGQ